jgi:hypothetical protein
VIRDDVAELGKPETRERGQHFAFAGDGCWQDAVESRDAIRCHNQELRVVNLVHVADFAAPHQLKI